VEEVGEGSLERMEEVREGWLERMEELRRFVGLAIPREEWERERVWGALAMALYV
jgi:hypothetical protein